MKTKTKAISIVQVRLKIKILRIVNLHLRIIYDFRAIQGSKLGTLSSCSFFIAAISILERQPLLQYIILYSLVHKHNDFVFIFSFAGVSFLFIRFQGIAITFYSHLRRYALQFPFIRLFYSPFRFFFFFLRPTMSDCICLSFARIKMRTPTKC